MSDPSIAHPDFDEPREWPGFRARRARLGRQAGSHRIGASLWELPPGEAAYPYHWHLAEEELIVVLSGCPSLRGPSGWRELDQGAVVAFPVGEQGGHQLMNRTEEIVRFLAVSNQQPDIVVRPDSRTIGVAERRPDGGGLYGHFRLGDAVSYLEGEQAP
ncbi:MAG: cupin domain-containing protein [Solirubrobacteraceae bacterium MAG38_C4-C5]|nr:cupin domain-containing protein [Candidatus Siliceabacter maunaloa]